MKIERVGPDSRERRTVAKPVTDSAKPFESPAVLREHFGIAAFDSG